jgi:hypothetical protein
MSIKIAFTTTNDDRHWEWTFNSNEEINLWMGSFRGLITIVDIQEIPSKNESAPVADKTISDWQKERLDSVPFMPPVIDIETSQQIPTVAGSDLPSRRGMFFGGKGHK